MKLLKNKSIIVMFLSKINDHICDVDNTYVARYIVWKNSKKNIDLVNDFCCFCDARSKKTKKQWQKKICLIFKIFLVTSAISSAFIFSMYLGIYSNLQRICQADPSAWTNLLFRYFFLQSFAKFDRASAILQCHMWHSTLKMEKIV